MEKKYKFLLHKTSDIWNYKEIEFDNLEELLKFIMDIWQVVIEYDDAYYNNKREKHRLIEDYDTWRE